MNFTRLPIKILEMENQPKRNRQRLKYAHIMAGSEVELNMYRAQVKTWVISTYHKWRCCACPISNKIFQSAENCYAKEGCFQKAQTGSW